MKIPFNLYKIFHSKIIPQKPQVIHQPKKILFCQEMWKDEFADGAVKDLYNSKVPYHGRFNAFNHLLIQGGTPEKFTTPNTLLLNKTVKEVITESDIDFKRLKPISEPLTVYRCIGKKPDFFSEYKLYLKKYNTKPGDIIYMPEYAYSASDINYAKCFLSDKNGIIYEIYVPKGARVSLTDSIQNGKMPPGNECVFPRASKFLCTERKMDENGHVHLTLKYILPDESWRKQ